MPYSEVVGKDGACSSPSMEFKWVIHHFNIDRKVVGQSFKSPKFTSSSFSDEIPREWRLKLYPRGRTHDDRGYLSLYLEANTRFKAACGFKFIKNINRNEGQVIVQRSLKEMKSRRNSLGYSKFSTRKLFADKGLDVNSKVTVVCEITVPAAGDKNKVQEQEPPRRFELSDLYETLFKGKNLTDVSLISEGRTITAHKSILANSSPVFDAMFKAEMKEKQTNIVNIEDVSYDVLEEMLRFIYVGRADNIDELAGELAVAADKYGLDELKHMCEETMSTNLDFSNVFYCLELAGQLCMGKLAKKAIKFIVKKRKKGNTIDKTNFKPLNSNSVAK